MRPALTQPLHGQRSSQASEKMIKRSWSNVILIQHTRNVSTWGATDPAAKQDGRRGNHHGKTSKDSISPSVRATRERRGGNPSHRSNLPSPPSPALAGADGQSPVDTATAGPLLLSAQRYRRRTTVFCGDVVLSILAIFQLN